MLDKAHELKLIENTKIMEELYGVNPYAKTDEV